MPNCAQCGKQVGFFSAKTADRSKDSFATDFFCNDKCKNKFTEKNTKEKETEKEMESKDKEMKSKGMVKEFKIKKSHLFLVIVIVFAIIFAWFNSQDNSPAQDSKYHTGTPFDLEMSMEELFAVFGDLSDLQVEEKVKEFKGKRIKTSIIADRIDKASLSTQYVVMEMYGYPYTLSPYAKAFFPKEQKDNLLKANLGDTIVFIGEFVTYHRGGLTSYIEFTNSRFVGVEEG